MAKTYRVRPAELLGLARNVADSYLAFAIDRAIWVFGTNVEHDMDDAETRFTQAQKNATAEQTTAVRRSVWEAYCYPDGVKDEEKMAPPKGRFADPASMIKASNSGG